MALVLAIIFIIAGFAAGYEGATVLVVATGIILANIFKGFQSVLTVSFGSSAKRLITEKKF